MDCSTCQKTAHFQEQGSQRAFCDVKCQRKFADMAAIGWSIFDDWNKNPGGVILKDILQLFLSIMSDPQKLQHFCYQLETTDNYHVRAGVAAKIPNDQGIQQAIFLHVCWNHFAAALSAILANRPAPASRALLNIGVMRVLQSNASDTTTMDCIVRLRDAGAVLQTKMDTYVQTAAETSKLSFIRYVVESGLFDPSERFTPPIPPPSRHRQHRHALIRTARQHFLAFCLEHGFWETALYILKDGRCSLSGNESLFKDAISNYVELKQLWPFHAECITEMLKDPNPNFRLEDEQVYYLFRFNRPFCDLLLDDPHNRVKHESVLEGLMEGSQSPRIEDKKKYTGLMQKLLAKNSITAEAIKPYLREPTRNDSKLYGKFLRLIREYYLQKTGAERPLKKQAGSLDLVEPFGE